MVFHPAPTQQQTMTIEGRLVYKPGPWGVKKPVRRFTIVNAVATEPPFANSAGSVSGPSHPVGTAMTDADGRFTLFAEPTAIPFNARSIEDRLELLETKTMERDTATLDSVVWGQQGIQDVGDIEVKWDPPLKTIARVNSESFSDTRKLAKRLAQLLMLAPIKPYTPENTRILLIREPDSSEDFTKAQELFIDLTGKHLKPDFPGRVRKEVNKIPMLRSNSKKVIGSILDYLYEISHRGPERLEKGTLLPKLVVAVGEALQRTVFYPVREAVPDMAAACVLLYAAGRMAKDQAKFTASFDTREFQGVPDRKFKTVAVTIGR